MTNLMTANAQWQSRPVFVCDVCPYATQSKDTVAAHSVNGHRMTERAISTTKSE